MDDNRIILEKLKKLIALSESPNEAEAASALSKVHLLLAKHSLSISDLDDETSSIIEKAVLNKKRLRNWESALLSTVMNATYTEVIHKPSEGKVYIIGREINVAAAENLFSYLHGTIKRISSKYTTVIKHADSFRYGMVVNINERLKSIEELSSAPSGSKEKQIIVSMTGETSSENKNFLDDNYGKIRKKRINSRVDPNSYGLGQKAGSKISLNKQIKR
jgi:uncharacterized protein DUF2786